MGRKIGIFAGDLFWSSCPYESLEIFKNFSVLADTDFIMFSKDIRLNKIFTGQEKFYFNTDFFINCKNLKVVKDWNEFYLISKDYEFIFASCKLAPKSRQPVDFNKNCKSTVCVWDCSGSDILTHHKLAGDRFFVKGTIWKKYLNSAGINNDRINIASCPQYDRFFRNDIKYGKTIDRESFYKKYNLNTKNKNILIAPSNPGSHKNQFKTNLILLNEIIELSSLHNFNVILKTYPHDYVFYEEEKMYTGVYRRMYSKMPMWKMLSDKFKEITVIESQDHYAALTHSEKLFNMSGSSIALETYFTNTISYSMNFKDTSYYMNVSYLPDSIIFPDDKFNIEVNLCKDIFREGSNLEKTKQSGFFETGLNLAESFFSHIDK
jgi:hypothetical protein